MERTLKNLRNSLTGKIYVLLKDAETQKQFTADAEKEGFKFGELNPSDSPADNIISLKENRQLAHVGSVGRIEFQSCGESKGDFHRIDYAKYIKGEDDYNVSISVSYHCS